MLTIVKETSLIRIMWIRNRKRKRRRNSVMMKKRKIMRKGKGTSRLHLKTSNLMGGTIKRRIPRVPLRSNTGFWHRKCLVMDKS